MATGNWQTVLKIAAGCWHLATGNPCYKDVFFSKCFYFFKICISNKFCCGALHLSFPNYPCYKYSGALHLFLHINAFATNILVLCTFLLTI